MVVTFLGLLGAFIARRTWYKVTREYDRSMLIRLGTNQYDASQYSSAPIIVGRFPFSDLGGAVRSNLDIRDVIGFVIGKPERLGTEDIKRLGRYLDPENDEPGYYAYCVIQWEHADTVKRFADQWLHIRRISYDDHNAESGLRERAFIGFSTNATPDESGTVPKFAHIDRGLLASFRHQPYLAVGFEAEDIEMRALALQARILIWFGKLPRRCKKLIGRRWLIWPMKNERNQ